MDTPTLVKEQIEDGRKLIDQLTRNGFDVRAAFWIKFALAESEPWFFYVVSTEEEKRGTQGAYRAVHEAIQQIPGAWGPWITVSELRLVNPTDTLASKVLSKQRYPEDTLIRPGQVGVFGVDGLYIYSIPARQQPLTAIHEEATRLKHLLQAGDTEKVQQGLDYIIAMSGQQIVRNPGS